MEQVEDQTVQELLSTILPWFSREQAFICDTARTDYTARLAVASALLEAGKSEEGMLLLQSIATADKTGVEEQDASRIRASVDLAYLLMDELKYDQAENLLWNARNDYSDISQLEFMREEISLMIAQCRFGQGFILEAIERTEEILHKLKSMDAGGEQLAKPYQYLGWFHLHKPDVPQALTHLKHAMELAPVLDRGLVDAGIEAEKNSDYEKAVECYFDSIQYD